MLDFESHVHMEGYYCSWGKFLATEPQLLKYKNFSNTKEPENTVTHQ